MNNKTISGMKCILYLFGLLLFGSPELFAEEVASKNVASDISNIGFIKNPPKELKENFPMCDAFLKVEWIDKEKKVGYSEYELYNQGKKLSRVAHALIYLDENHPVFDVNLDEFREKGKLKDTFDLIKRGEFEDQDPGFGLILDVERNGKNYGYKFSDILSDWDMPLLTIADHKMNVCIPYPDNQRMYFAEQKALDKIYNKSEIDNKRAELKQWIENVSFMERYTPIDVNSDGKEDYLAGTRTIYSHEGKYVEMKIIKPRGSANSKLISPTTGKTCEFQNLWPGGDYFTTAGKNIFIDNQCNLTELTK